MGGDILTLKIADYQLDQYFEVREYQAAAAAAGLEVTDVQALKGKPSDIGTPTYSKLRQQLVRIKKSDSRIKYTDEGHIDVKVDCGGDPIVFTVADTGPGIPDRFREQAFNKFSQLHLSTDSRKRGAGMGLRDQQGPRGSARRPHNGGEQRRRRLDVPLRDTA